MPRPPTRIGMPYVLGVPTQARGALAVLVLASVVGACGSSASTSTVAAGASTSLAAGRAVFSGTAGCDYCHTLAAAGAIGEVGPDLDTHLRADCAMLLAEHSHGTTLRQCIETMIVHPYEFIPGGYLPNVMPSDFGKKLSQIQIEALANFLATDAK